MRREALFWSVAGGCLVAGVLLLLRPAGSRVACGKGFAPKGARCMPEPGCPFALTEHGCSTELRVGVDRTRLTVGPSDWEAEGKVAPRVVEAGPFWIDAYEATRASFVGGEAPDPLQAASAMTRDEAASFCAKRAGRLPTEDEWIIAASGAGGHRYPWGETGAVCSRAAFGLSRGPCSSSGVGPDTVGAHESGDSTKGVHDLAGNVAEWVAPTEGKPEVGVAKGGSWRSELATELRVWARLELDPKGHDDRVGVRCVYDAP